MASSWRVGCRPRLSNGLLLKRDAVARPRVLVRLGVPVSRRLLASILWLQPGQASAGWRSCSIHWASKMSSIRLVFVLLFLAPATAHSASSCLTPDRPAEFPATISSATGEYSETTRHLATSSGTASETQYQLWLLRSGRARVQRDYWTSGGFDDRSTTILRGSWSIESGYVVLVYGGYCGTFELSPLAADSLEPQRLRGIHGRPSSAWLLLAVLERTVHEGEPTAPM